MDFRLIEAERSRMRRVVRRPRSRKQRYLTIGPPRKEYDAYGRLGCGSLSLSS